MPKAQACLVALGIKKGNGRLRPSLLAMGKLPLH